MCVREGGKRVLIKIGTQALKQTVATTVGVEGGGWVALELGADAETVELLKRGAYGAIQLRGLLKGLRLDRMFAKSLPKPTAKDPELQRIVNDIYKPTAAVASGSTADAVRFEKATGLQLSASGHVIAAKERINRLMKWLHRNPNAHPSDRKAAYDMIEDMDKALRGQ
jgi:hypothetical protein